MANLISLQKSIKAEKQRLVGGKTGHLRADHPFQLRTTPQSM